MSDTNSNTDEAEPIQAWNAMSSVPVATMSERDAHGRFLTGNSGAGDAKDHATS